MAKAVFTAAWWKKNKAITLLDSGDSVEKALKAFEAAATKNRTKGSAETVDAYIDTVKGVDVAAAALEKKANKLLHKDSIGYLQDYQDEADKLAKAASKAAGLIAKADKLTLNNALKEAAFETYCKKSFNEEQFEFLLAMQKANGRGSKKVYDEFIKAGSRSEINISGALRKQITEEDGPWDQAVKVVESLMKDVLVRFKADTAKGLAAALA